MLEHCAHHSGGMEGEGREENVSVFAGLGHPIGSVGSVRRDFIYDLSTQFVRIVIYSCFKQCVRERERVRERDRQRERERANEGAKGRKRRSLSHACTTLPIL